MRLLLCPPVSVSEYIQDKVHAATAATGLWRWLDNHSFESSSARFVAATTAFMKAARIPLFSSSCTPAMVVPPGEVTMSCKERGVGGRALGGAGGISVR